VLVVSVFFPWIPWPCYPHHPIEKAPVAMRMRTLKYLAYGSNLHPMRLRQRVPSARPVAVIGLDGWRLSFHKRGRDNSGKCNIIRSPVPADRVYAAVYEIDPVEKHALDEAESLGCGYEEMSLAVGRYGEVFCYTAGAGFIDESLVPYTWYRDYVSVGARFHQLPETYVRTIEVVEALQDPDSDRQKRNMRIMAKLRDD
jgi:gamma-glutamylcyclotransferase